MAHPGPASERPPEPPTPFELAVLDGLHGGAALPLDAGTVVIGSGPDCDIVLHDPGIAPQHLKLDLRPEGLRLAPLAPGVAIAGAPLSPAAPDEPPAAAGYPAQIVLAGVPLRVSGPAPAAPDAQGRRWPVRMLLGCLLACGVAGGMAVLLLPGAGLALPKASLLSADAGAKAMAAPAGLPQAPANPPQSGTAPGAPASMRPTDGAPVPPAAEGPSPAEDLRASLQRAGLHSITLAQDGTVLTASGTVDPRLLGEWRRLEEAFDVRHAGAAQLVNRVAVKADAPLGFAVDAVWLGPNPNVIINGQKYLEGASLPEGWTLRRVEAHRLVLVRGGREAAVPF